MSYTIFAVYDIRGIQDYIFRSSKLKDVKGASKIIEDIFLEALNEVMKQTELKGTICWFDDNGPIPFEEKNDDFQVVYDGGGNSYVLYKDKKQYKKANKIMSKYIIENTYSLQLVSAYVEVSGDYEKDFKILRNRLDIEKNKTKGNAMVGALPIMKIEVNTGLPIVNSENKSRETLLKEKKADYISNDNKYKILDNYVFEKYSDSNLAVVHIDGNNMAKRIMNITSDLKDYKTAIDTMRDVSYNINSSYKKVFEQLAEKCNDTLEQSIMKVVIAGDDVTYICTGRIALPSVEFFTKEINKYAMKDKDVSKYGFSVCAGVAFFRSHFPFYAAYEVAEKCCENAKNRAKTKIVNDKIPNYVDFHICNNSLQAANLDITRKNEYVTPFGENLLLRPYCITEDSSEDIFSYDSFKKLITYFNNDEIIAKSKSKDLRNTYPLGSFKTNDLCVFLNSRKIVLPDKTTEAFIKLGDGATYAKWYDALEMLDLFMELK